MNTTPHNPADPGPAPRPVERLLAILLTGTLLTILALRTTTSFDPFPAWAADPLLVASPVVAITPAVALMLDALTLLATSLLTLLLARRGISPSPLELGLFLAGSAAVLLHTLALSTRTLDDVIIGSAWLSALATGLAVTLAARDPLLRALIAGTFAALTAAFALRAGLQVFVDHPQTVRMFKETRSTFLASQGWTEGSPMALAYERRLMQAEGSAWFGMANVLASTGAASLTLALGLLASNAPSGWLPGWPGGPRRSVSLSDAQTRPPLALFTLAILALTTLILAGSKGGYAAALLGVVLLAVAHLAPRFVTSERVHRATSLLGPLLILAALLAIALRGVIGERIAELSLLFRWFYIQGATRVFLDHALLGVGPAGFKDAYMLAKPALSPEDVSSPHSVLFDFAACLGVLGLGWAALLILWSSRAGRSLVASPAQHNALNHADHADHADHDASDTVAALRTPLLAILAISTGAASVIERPMATLEGTLVRVIALALGLWIAICVARLVFTNPRAASAALAAAALVAIVHAQIELTATHANSAMWLMVIVALAAPRPQPPRTPAPTSRSTSRLGLISAAALCLIAVAVALPIPSVYRWQSLLISAEEAIAPVREVDRLMREGGSTPTTAALEEARSILQPLIAPRLTLDPQSIAAGFDLYRSHALSTAFIDLRAARDSIRSTPHFASEQALMMLAMRMPNLNGTQVAEIYLTDPMGQALEMARQTTHRAPDSAGAWAWLAVVAENAKGRTPALEPGTAAKAWSRASDLAPRDPEFARRAALALRELDQADAARAMARRALTNHENARLDPLRQLTPAKVAEMTGLAGE